MKRVTLLLALLMLASCKRRKPLSFDRVVLERAGACGRTTPTHETVCWGDEYGPGTKGGGPPIEGPGKDKASGDHHTCMRLANNTVACSGENAKHQLADGTIDARTDPVPAFGIIGAIDISAAGDGTCVALADGDIRCWGENDHGQLGPRLPRGILNVPTILILDPPR